MYKFLQIGTHLNTFLKHASTLYSVNVATKSFQSRTLCQYIFAGHLQISHKSIAKVTMINFKFLKLSKTCKWRLRQILLLAPVICHILLVEHINNSESIANYIFLNNAYHIRKYTFDVCYQKEFRNRLIYRGRRTINIVIKV